MIHQRRASPLHAARAGVSAAWCLTLAAVALSFEHPLLLATLLGVTLARVHAGDLTLLQALDLLTARPARLLGLPVGRLAKGAPADLVLFQPDRAWKVEAGRLPGKAQNSPFDGRALEGRVIGTWKAGRRVFGA